LTDFVVAVREIEIALIVVVGKMGLFLLPVLLLITSSDVYLE